MKKLLLLLLVVFPFMMQAQNISGKVVDKNGIPLAGVNVKALNSAASTITDLDGNFKLNLKQSDDLQFSMVGYETIVLKSNANLNPVRMTESVTTLADVVVIGYGTRKRIDNTSAITSLKAEDVTKTKVLNAAQAIQGKASGVQVISSDAPGAQPSVIIRGLGTALGGRSPLYIVDGMPTESIANINSNDITSFEILKDASALAVYGNRAANGVIIITTKKGKGKMNVELDSFIGFRKPQSLVKMAGSNKFAFYTNMALGSTSFSQDQPVNTDWFDEITQTGTYYQNNIAVSGASDEAKYFFSLGNYEEKSILQGMDFNRLTFRTNNEFKLFKKVTLSQNFSAGYTRNNPKPFSAFTTAYKQSPIVPVYFSTGQYGVSFVAPNGFASPTGSSSFNNVGNPVAQLDFFDEHQKALLLQGGLKLDFDIVKELKFTSQFNAENYSFKGYNYSDDLAIWLAADPTRTPSAYLSTSNLNTLTRVNDGYFNWNLSNYITFHKVFATKHDVELVLGNEASSKSGNFYTQVVRKNVNANSDYWSLNGTEYAQDVQSYREVQFNGSRLSSYFARLQYKFSDRYLLSATVRRDGSSQFGKDYRWGTFPSVGLGWIISKESFLADVKGLDFLKLRASWGKLGNQYVPLNSQSFTTGLNYYFTQFLSGTTINSQIDPALTWEVTKETSGGLDFEMLNRKLKGSFDLYSKRTDNLILKTKPYITSGVGLESPAHVGEVSNKGYEIALRWDDKINDNLSYYVGANFSHNKNRLESLTNPNIATITGGGLGNGQYTKILDNSSVGQPLGSFFIYEYAGYDSTGQMLYYKADGSTVTQDGLAIEDRKYVGSILPNGSYGISLGATYKSFDLSVDAYGTMGSKVYNGKKAQRFSGENIEDEVASDFWTPLNTNAANPAAFNEVPVASTYYLESGDFLRINNITIGYKLPNFSKHISYARVYFNAINPFITKKFSGYTPELNGDGNPYGSQGVELDAYPTLKSFVFGVNLKF